MSQLNKNKMLCMAWYTPVADGWGLPLLVTAPAGATKTAEMASFARKMCSPFLHLSPGQKGEGYFGVSPVLSKLDGEDVLGFPAPLAIHEMNSLGRGLILLDELRSSPPVVMPAMLGTAQERMFGDVRLAPGIRVFSASNSAKEAVNGRALAAPVANRFTHIGWEDPTPAEAEKHHRMAAQKEPFLSRGAVDFAAYTGGEIEDKLIGVRPMERSRAAAEVFAFVGRYPTPIMRKQPLATSPDSDGPWPSPRSWSNAIDVLWTYRGLRNLGVIGGPDSEQDDLELNELLRGTVGPVAGELLEWLQQQDLPDYAEWLDGKSSVSFDPDRDDRSYAIMSGASSHILSLTDEKLASKRAEAFWKHANALHPSAGYEVVNVGAGKLLQQATEGARHLIASKEAQLYMSTFRKATSAVLSGV